MSSRVEEFKDITIEKSLKPVRSLEKKHIYYLPILLTANPPQKWMEAFHSAYGECKKYSGEQILQPHQIHAKKALPTRLLEDELAGKHELGKLLLFQFSVGGKGPHPNTPESLRISCEKANKEYRRHLNEEDKRRERELQRLSEEEEQQNQKDRRAEELTRGWFDESK